MIRSMTGFGRGRVSEGEWTAEALLKAVNHRYLELRIRGLEEREELELRARQLLANSFARGKLELSVELEHIGDKGVAFDLEAVRRYHRGLKELCDELGLVEGVRLTDLIALGALRLEEPQEELGPLLEGAMGEAIAQTQAMREVEGQRLRSQLLGYLVQLDELTGQVEARAPGVKLYHKEQLQKRAKELLEYELDDERLEEEAVLFAERSDITEELARLRSHLAAAGEALESNEPTGKLLDFLAQEMFREVNTVSAKARDGEILGRTVAMRGEIEKIREQVRNIE